LYTLAGTIRGDREGDREEYPERRQPRILRGRGGSGRLAVGNSARPRHAALADAAPGVARPAAVSRACGLRHPAGALGQGAGEHRTCARPVHPGAKLVHFLADWNFRIVPGIGYLFRRARVVTIARKESKPKFLTVFRRFYQHKVPPMERARAHLLAGRPIGIFPEGGVNRDSRRLLIGRLGMARLSLETGVPVVPVGIRYPDIDRDKPTPESAAMEIEIGEAMTPPECSTPPTAGEVRRWHAAVMGEIARLSGKHWGR
jgi:hypothetical protein